MAMGNDNIRICRQVVSYFNTKWLNSDYQQTLDKVQLR